MKIIYHKSKTGIGANILAICILVGAFSVTHAAGKLHIFDLSNFEYDEEHDKTTRWHGVFIENPEIVVSVVNESNVSSAESSFLKKYCDAPRLALTGGFFSNSPEGLSPIGLHVSNGKKIYDASNWTSGGFLYQKIDGSFSLSHVSKKLPGDIKESLQSKPFIIEDGKVAVKPRNDHTWDRIAVGDGNYRGKDGMFIVAAISDLSKRESIQLHFFADAVAKIANSVAVTVRTMMNLDGAEGPFIWYATEHSYDGPKSLRYIPSILCIY